MLAQREHSRLQLEQKLALKGFDGHEVQAVLDELAEQGWQSDQRFSESYARQRLAKGYGAMKVLYEIQQRGGVEVDLQPIVEELYGSWAQLLEDVYVKRFDDRQRISYQDWAKRQRFLQQRGFSSQQIRQLSQNLEICLQA